MTLDVDEQGKWLGSFSWNNFGIARSVDLAVPIPRPNDGYWDTPEEAVVGTLAIKKRQIADVAEVLEYLGSALYGYESRVVADWLRTQVAFQEDKKQRLQAMVNKLKALDLDKLDGDTLVYW